MENGNELIKDYDTSGTVRNPEGLIILQPTSLKLAESNKFSNRCCLLFRIYHFCEAGNKFEISQMEGTRC